MNVSVIIPTYNGCQLLKRNLPSVMASLRPGDELIIADDSSTDRSAAWLKKKFSLKQVESTVHLSLLEGKVADSQNKVKVIVGRSNLRFAANVNRAVNFAHQPLIFLLNNDVKLEPGTTSCLAKQFTSKSSHPLFAVGCLEYEGIDRSARKAGKNSLWFEKGMFVHSRANNFVSGQTAWASGGSAMFSRAKWQELGGFDVNFYPAYWEDIDLSFRASKKGWRVLFSQDCVVYHQHQSTHDDVFTKRQIEQISLRNARYFSWKNGNLWQKIAYLLWQPYWRVKQRSIND